MCTAISKNIRIHCFGRNLDLEKPLGESTVIVPRNFRLNLRKATIASPHYAFIGSALIENGFPLCFEATNEQGLSVAALRFTECKYAKEVEGFDNVASFELIPWILSKCKSTDEARILLSRTNITGDPFSETMPSTPLHWIIDDKNSTITVECTETGMKIYDNKAGILTNSPCFPFQMLNLNNYLSLSEKPPINLISPRFEPVYYSRGLGAIGLPGDFSSMSRFVKGFFVKEKISNEETEEKSIVQFFHILDSVSQKKGCVELPDGSQEYTVYASCCDENGVFYYKSYYGYGIEKTDMHSFDLNTCELISKKR